MQHRVGVHEAGRNDARRGDRLREQRRQLGEHRLDAVAGKRRDLQPALLDDRADARRAEPPAGIGIIVDLGDIDLTSFGPYYGDAWSSLADFERTLGEVRKLEARRYATFHHIGVLDGREPFLDRLDRFTAVIQSREQRLVEFLHEPRTLDAIVAHRFVYRPGDPEAKKRIRFCYPKQDQTLLEAGRRLATITPRR